MAKTLLATTQCGGLRASQQRVRKVLESRAAGYVIYTFFSEQDLNENRRSQRID